MNRARNILYGLYIGVAMAFTVVVTACEHDSYDTGDGSLSYLRCDMADAHSDAQCHVDAFVTDEGTRIVPASPVGARWMSTPDSVYRVQVYYDCQTFDVKQLSRVLTLLPVSPDKVKVPKTDPLNVESSWRSTNNKYINLCLAIKAGTTTDDETGVQSVTLVSNGPHLHVNGRITARFTLYHDQAGVPQYYTVRQYASLPLAEVGAADSVSITVNTYAGLRTLTLSTKP